MIVQTLLQLNGQYNVASILSTGNGLTKLSAELRQADPDKKDTAPVFVGTGKDVSRAVG